MAVGQHIDNRRTASLREFVRKIESASKDTFTVHYVPAGMSHKKTSRRKSSTVNL